MSNRELPPPPLTAPTPSNARPPEEPFRVIAVAAWAGVDARTSVPAVATMRVDTKLRRRRRRLGPLAALGRFMSASFRSLLRTRHRSDAGLALRGWINA